MPIDPVAVSSAVRAVVAKLESMLVVLTPGERVLLLEAVRDDVGKRLLLSEHEQSGSTG